MWLYSIIIATVSATCPYFENGYYSTSEREHYHYRFAAINQCQTGIGRPGFAAQMFICIDNEVFVNFYENETSCNGEGGERLKVGQSPDESHGEYMYSCDNTDCTNYFKWQHNPSSINETEQCTDPIINNYDHNWQIGFGLTDICMNGTSYNGLHVLSYKYGCNITGSYMLKYNNSDKCDVEPIFYAYWPIQGCFIKPSDWFGVPDYLYGKMAYCDGINYIETTYNPSVSPSNKPTLSESPTTYNPSESPTLSSFVISSTIIFKTSQIISFSVKEESNLFIYVLIGMSCIAVIGFIVLFIFCLTKKRSTYLPLIEPNGDQNTKYG